MNNSIERLFAGMIGTLRHNILPHVADEFARGQAFGVIFMLNSIARRASWSTAHMSEQIAALQALAERLEQIEMVPAEMPNLREFVEQAPALDPARARDLGDAQVCAMIDWLSRAQLSAETRVALFAAIDTYVHRQLKHEIATSAKPMFAEISRGAED